jgi:serine/threonine protein kinase
LTLLPSLCHRRLQSSLASVSTPSPLNGTALDADKGLTFAQTYELKEKLGKGQYAVVHRAVHRRSGMECAVKCIRKATLTAEDLAALEVSVGGGR